MKAVALRRAGRTIPLVVAVPRMIAASLFFALLVSAPLHLGVWLHVVAIAVPYVIACELPRRPVALTRAAGDAA